MMMLPEWQRKRLVTSAKLWLKDRCKLEEEISIRGEFGEPLHGWNIVADDIPCRVITAGSKGATSAVSEAGAQENIQDEYRLVVTEETPLSVDQRVTVGEQVYSIVHIETALTDQIFRHAVITRRV